MRHIRVCKVIFQIVITQRCIYVHISIVIVKSGISLAIIVGVLSNLQHLVAFEVINMGFKVEFRDFRSGSFSVRVLRDGLLGGLFAVLVWVGLLFAVLREGLFEDLVAFEVDRFVQVQSQVLYSHLVECFLLFLLSLLGIWLQAVGSLRGLFIEGVREHFDFGGGTHRVFANIGAERSQRRVIVGTGHKVLLVMSGIVAVRVHGFILEGRLMIILIGGIVKVIGIGEMVFVGIERTEIGFEHFNF